MGGGGLDERHVMGVETRFFTTGAEKTAAQLAGVEKSYLGATASGAKLDAALSKNASRFKMISQQAFTTGVAFYGVNVIVSTLIGGIGQLGSELFSFESNLKNVQIASGKSADDIANLSNEMIDATVSGDTYGAMLGNASAALYEIEQAGFHGAAGTDILSQAENNAAAGQADLIASSRLLTAMLNAYAGTGLTAKQASDSLFQTILDGVITFDQLAAHMGQVLPTAAATGVNVRELGAAVAVLTQRGQEAAPALTAINQFLTAYLKPSQAAIDLSKRLGLEFNASHLEAVGLATALEEVITATGGNETQLTTLYGNVRALRAILPLAADGGELFNKMLGNQVAASAGAGAAARAMEIRSGSLMFQFKALWAQASGLVTGGLLPMASAFLGPLAGGLSFAIAGGAPFLLMLARFEPLFMAVGTAAALFGAKLLAVKFGHFIGGMNSYMAVFQPAIFATQKAAAMEAVHATETIAAAAAIKAKTAAAAELAAAQAFLDSPVPARLTAEELYAKQTIASAAAINAKITGVEALTAAETSLATSEARLLAAEEARTAALATNAGAIAGLTTATGAAAMTQAELAASQVAATATGYSFAGAIRTVTAATWGLIRANLPLLAATAGIIIAWKAWEALTGPSEGEKRATEATDKLTTAINDLTQAQFENDRAFQNRKLSEAITLTEQYIASTDKYRAHFKGMGDLGLWSGDEQEGLRDQAAGVMGLVKNYSELSGKASPRLLDAIAAEAHEIGQLNAFLGDSNDAWAESTRRHYAAIDSSRNLVLGLLHVNTALDAGKTAAEGMDTAIEDLFNKPGAAESALIAIRDRAKAMLTQSEALPLTPERSKLERSLLGAIDSADAQIGIYSSARQAGESGVAAGAGTDFFNDLPGITATDARLAGESGKGVSINGNTFIIQANTPEELAEAIKKIGIEDFLQQTADALEISFANMAPAGSGRR